MTIDWKSRAEVLADPDHSDMVKRAMMRFWLAADKHDWRAALYADGKTPDQAAINDAAKEARDQIKPIEID